MSKNPMVEEIEQLWSCQTHAERAEWLLSCPLPKLFTYQDTIINRLRNAGFLAGVDYLEAELHRWRKPRVLGAMLALNGHAADMLAIARPGAQSPVDE